MSNNVKVGLTVVVGLIVLALVLIWAKGIRPGQDRRTITLVFPDAQGLQSGEPVMINGVKLGQVTDVEVMPDGARVTAEIVRQPELKTDASATIGLLELMGGKRVNLEPGHAAAPLPDGAIIAGRSTLDIPGALARVGEMTDSVDLRRTMRGVDETIASVNGLVSDPQTQAEMREILTNLAAASKDLASVSRLVARNETKLQATMDRLASTSARLDELARTDGPKLGRLASSADTTLTATRDLVARVDSLVAGLHDQRTVAGAVLNDPAFLLKLNTTLDALNLLLNDLRTKGIRTKIDLF